MKQSMQPQTVEGRRRPFSLVVAKLTLATAAIVVLSLGVSAALVGAISTDHSAIRSNEFAQAQRIEAGIYDLAATASSTAGFGPGQASGSVSFSMQPEGAKPLALETLEVVTATVSLPRGMKPLELPATETTEAYSQTWSAEGQEGTWQVQMTLTALTHTEVNLPRAEFIVGANFVDIVPEEALTMTASIGLPERFTSLRGEESIVVPAVWNVNAGVYELAFAAGNSRTEGVISFASHPEQGGEKLHLRKGDVLTTSLVLPAGVTAPSLPATDISPARTVEWSMEGNGAETIVTRTERISGRIEHVDTANSAFTVELEESTLREGFGIEARANLPVRFVSAHATEQIEVSGKIGPPAASRVAAGRGHSLAVRNDGALFAWGLGNRGQLGSGSGAGSTVPVLTHSPSGRSIDHVVAGWEYSLAVADDGTLWAWGDNYFSQTGTGLPTSQTVTEPTQVSASDGSVRFLSASAGWRHSAALSTDGRVYVWGDGSRGVLGNGLTSGIVETPVLMQGLPNKRFIAVEVGFDVTFALSEDGEVWVAGSSEQGVLGLGQSISEAPSPRLVPMPVTEAVVQVSVSSTTNNTHVLAITESGALLGWGLNTLGEVGVPVAEESDWAYYTPTELQMPAETRFVKVAAGEGFSLGLSDDGFVYSWGGHALGNGTSGSSVKPVRVSTPSQQRFVDIAAGDVHALALSADGTVFTWGKGDGGRLGTGSEREQLTPTVIKLNAQRTAIALGEADDAPGEETLESEENPASSETEPQPEEGTGGVEHEEPSTVESNTDDDADDERILSTRNEEAAS